MKKEARMMLGLTVKLYVCYLAIVWYFACIYG